MIKYICKNCDNLSCETSVCPICGRRTEMVSSTIFWSAKHNCPVFDEYVEDEKCAHIASDARPVFPEERLLLEVLINKPMEYAGHSMWNTGNNYYLVDGKRIGFSYAEMEKNNPLEVIEKLKQYSEENKKYVDSFYEQDYVKEFIKINKPRFDSIVDESHQYIKSVSDGWSLDEMFVSFSGGKDSTVTSSLVINALGEPRIPHIYGDTTLEYPTSKTYIERFKRENNETPLLVAKNRDQEFNNLCEVIGPPSRTMRWCCTIFKTGAITKKIESTFKDKNKILTFQGIRRNESASRSKYDRESNDSKIKKQKVVSPIIDWLDFDVWLYILTTGIDFNDAYRQGFARVGCWCCPNNSGWSGYLSSIYMNNEYTKFYNMLYSFAKKVGKPDWKEYIDTGKWKARQGGNGLEASSNAVVTFKPCALEENAYNFELSRPISENLYTLFKPFGKLDFAIGNKRLNEVYVLDKKTNEPLLKLTGKLDKKELKVSVLKKTPRFSNTKVSQQLINCQITKYQTCIGCSGCQSVCKFDALKVINLNKGDVSRETISYTINEDKCVGCLECVTHFDNGCYMKKVLRTKING